MEPDPLYGQLVRVAPVVRRLVARNPGPFTYLGTNCYLVGDGVLTLVDAGPAGSAHIEMLLRMVRGERISHILLTHGHPDHAPAARPLADATGAAVLGHGALAPDVALADGAVVETPAGRFLAIATPGHAADHLAFALAGADLVFSGDHVMGWSTTVVAPPEGSMRAYMRSLVRLGGRPERIYLPGHGAPILDGPLRVGVLAAHREARARAILAAVRAGQATLPAIVAAAYPGLDPALAGGARGSTLAHLVDLVERGLLREEPGTEPSYRPV